MILFDRGENVREQYFTLAASDFEAARQIDNAPLGHRSRRLHGHSFRARVRAALPAEWARFSGAELETLRTRLAECITPLDYSFLNDYLAVPSDENLARWVDACLDVPGNRMIGIQSTRDQGVDLDEARHAHAWRRFRFEAAHQLPNVPVGHKCGRMHGHGFEVVVHADQEALGHGSDHIETSWAPLQEELHQSCLNDLSGLENPTSEMLAAWIWERLKCELPSLSWVTVYETAKAGCHYSANTYHIWKEQSFEAAMSLRQAPEGDARRNLHGHSYVIKLHLTAPLDAVTGWTVDYGDVKELFKPVYSQLDHWCLDELNSLDGADVHSLLRWIKAQMAPRLPQLDRLDLFETPGCGGLLYWGAERPIVPL